MVQYLLDSALDPVVEERLKGKKGEGAWQAILDIKVCDPACGSGHFLIAAAHRLARHLARVRTGETEPSPEDYQHALRDVIGRCVYGVDLNPMAVELCKVSLWMEAIEPGKPLSFLDHHIQCGNSLLGTTPALLAKGIPDEAFTAIEGDVQERVAELKKDNKRERADYKAGQGYLFSPILKLGNLPATIARINSGSDESLEDVAAKHTLYEELVQGADYLNARLLADVWCSAFVWKKNDSDLGQLCPTERDLRSVEDNPHGLSVNVREEVQRLSGKFGFFHWHIAFPDVFRVPAEDTVAENSHTSWNGGFDLVLGNPPWDTLSPDQREFFSIHVPAIRSLSPSEQEQAIAEVLEDSSLLLDWQEHCRTLFATVAFLKNSGVFTLYAKGNLGKGDFNVYRMFVEQSLRVSGSIGTSSMVVPGGLYGGANASAIRKYFFQNCSFRLLLGLINTQRHWFPEVDIDRFAAYVVKKGGHTTEVLTKFGLSSAVDLDNAPVPIASDLIRELSSDTFAIPDIRRIDEVRAISAMYRGGPRFGDESAGEPLRVYQTEIHMGNDRELFTDNQAGMPLYEGRMVDRFDHRAKVYVSGHGNSAKWEERAFGDASKGIVPQWRVRREDIPSKLGDRPFRYRIGFGDVANPRNERSFVSTLIPPGTLCGHTVPTILFRREYEWAYLPWLGVANSFAMDSLARRKLSSPHMTYTIMDSLPFPRLPVNDYRVEFLGRRVLRLVCVSEEMLDYWNAMVSYGWCEQQTSVPEEAFTTPEQRFRAMTEIDAFVALHVFGLTRIQIAELMDGFAVLCKRETKEFGTFRSRDELLKTYDELSECGRNGSQFASPLDLPACKLPTAASPGSKAEHAVVANSS